MPIAIASGALTHEIEEMLDRAGLRELFLAVVGADQTARSKPSPDPYLEAFAPHSGAPGTTSTRRGPSPSRTRVWGLVSARTAGLRRVAVTNTYSARRARRRTPSWSSPASMR